MAPISIQIIETNPHLRSLLGWHLQQLGYVVCPSATLQQARDVAQAQRPMLVVLDPDLPDGDGLEFCAWLQRVQQPMVLMISARSGEADAVAALRAGADDYLRKPFGMQEFLARVQALVRRGRSRSAPALLDCGVLRIDLIQRRVWLFERSIELTPQEFSLLYALAQAGGVPLSRAEILQRAWPESIDNPRTVDTHVLSLRKKLEADPRQPSTIQTVRNVGYRLNLERLELHREPTNGHGPPPNPVGGGPAGSGGGALSRSMLSVSSG
ncbi:MAG: DNA-binding response regulator [Limnothrix sp. CACIAM 69d]|nr:MAG: DNA-binding response regulator [Limnothrix sp. CACIAM 69d]